MPDPFEALHSPAAPVPPDPAFTRRLRARLERALDLPEGVTVSNLALEELEHAPAHETATEETGAGAAIPYLAVTDARRAIEWYVDVLGAHVVGEPIVMPDERIGHAELALAGGTLYLADEFPEIGVVAPTPATSAVSLVLNVADVDALVHDAVDTGATLLREIGEGHGSRNATIADPFGHRWMLQTPLDTPTATAQREGDIAYASLWVPDGDRAASFYGAVLGWTYGAASPGHARQVEGTTTSQGLMGGHERSTLFLCYAVDDIHDAIARVRDAGGTASEATAEPHGLISECVDDQGTQFALVEVPGPAAGDAPPENGVREGDLAYVTMTVPDSARARTFYGAVLGWSFTPGHVEDGWNIEGPSPMIGMVGGADVATAAPMYRVDDIADAVDRVRAAGGTATDPAQRPYGLESDCIDDQGTHFWLGQL